MNRLLIGITLWFASLSGQMTDWTWFYQKTIDAQELQAIQDTPTIIFQKVDVPAFTQLVFSWNAARPHAGKFTFWCQVRDLHTKKWYRWHKMVEWGAKVQKSFLSRSRGTRYEHVRLELPDQKFADGFRIKIELTSSATLAQIKSLGVCVSDMTQFKREHVTGRLMAIPSCYIKSVPRRSQRALRHSDPDKICSPTSMSMLVEYLVHHPINPVTFAKKVYDSGLGAFGSWPFNTAHAFELASDNYFFHVKRLHSFAALCDYLSRSIPVVVSIRGHIEGGQKVYGGGHFIVVVGWDNEQKKVICHDPAFERDNKTMRRYSLKSFLRAWERSRRLAYVAQEQS